MAVIVRPLPATRQDLEAARVLKVRPTILDLVEPIVKDLWEDEAFKRLIDAIDDADAVEGSMEVDDTMAAILIREYAKEHKHKDVAAKNLTTLRHALRLVLRRYTASRKQRSGESNDNDGTSAPAAE